MKINDLVLHFGLTLVAGRQNLNTDIQSGYCGDLLSDVMGKAPSGCIWLTIQGHQNIVAVAVLKEMAGIVVTGGYRPDADTIQRADQEGIALLLWPGFSFELAGKLYQAGLL
jgi:predicted transcriptional regulator